MLYNLFENRDFVSVFAVALLAEGVDRNVFLPDVSGVVGSSPSSRRAWIEIRSADEVRRHSRVALLAEGVDRNSLCLLVTRFHQRSPSSRRAWIEISMGGGNRPEPYKVALLAEGVDRNSKTFCHKLPDFTSPSSRRAWIEILMMWSNSSKNISRPPRGGRG